MGNSVIKDYQAIAYCASKMNALSSTLSSTHGDIDKAIELASWTGTAAEKTKSYFESLSFAKVKANYDSIADSIQKVAKSIANYEGVDATLKASLNGSDYLTALDNIAKNVTDADYQTYINSLGVYINGVLCTPGELTNRLTYTDANGNSVNYFVYVPENIGADREVVFYYCGSGELSNPTNSRIAKSLTSNGTTDKIIVFLAGNGDSAVSTNFSHNKKGLASSFIKDTMKSCNSKNYSICGFSAGGWGMVYLLNDSQGGLLKDDLGDLNLSNVYLISQSHKFDDSTLEKLQSDGVKIYSGYSSSEGPRVFHDDFVSAATTNTENYAAKGGDSELLVVDQGTHGDSELLLAEKMGIVSES